MKILIITVLAFMTAQAYAGAGLSGTSATTSKVTYLGNEGLLVQHGDSKVLFDPFFNNGFDTYQLVPEDIRKALFSGAPPYDGINAIFISHAHGDHFSANDTANYLQQHPETILIAPKQAIDKLDLPKGHQTTIVSIDLAYQDAPVYQTLGEIEFDAVRIPHAGWPQRADIANLLFRVRLNGELTVAHMGDADPDDAHFKPLVEHWNRKVTNTAFPPYWFFVSRTGPMILKERIRANANIGVHVPIKVPLNLFQSGEHYFTEPGKGVTLN